MPLINECNGALNDLCQLDHNFAFIPIFVFTSIYTYPHMLHDSFQVGFGAKLPRIISTYGKDESTVGISDRYFTIRKLPIPEGPRKFAANPYGRRPPFLMQIFYVNAMGKYLT